MSHSQLRASIRNYCYPMTLSEIFVELGLSFKNKDLIRANYVKECFDEEFKRLIEGE